MKLLITIAVLFWTLQVSGQSLQKIKQLLAEKDFTAFKAYIDTASKKYSRVNPDSKVRAIWELERDLTATFQECVVDADESFPDEDEPNISTVERYRIKILATSKEIIFYDFAEKESNGASWNDFRLNIIDSYCNEKLMSEFKKDFFDNYNDSINQKELFNDSNVYGFACSIVGLKPKMREENDLIVKNKDIQQLTMWLKSANTEKQVYGIDGLFQLKKKGYKLTEEQLRLIKIIKNKRGSLNVCNGCIFSSDRISKIVKIILGRYKI